METWGAIFKESGNETLIAMMPELATLIAAAKAAAAMLEDASSANRRFRDVGERKQFIDKVNAVRNQTYGELGKLPFEKPGLPSDFADQFFRTETREEEEEEAPTIETVKASIAELKAELTAQEALLLKLEAQAEAEKKAAAEAQAREDQLAALKAQAAEILKKAAELEAQLTKR